MRKTILLALLTLLTMPILADGVKIGDLYYNLNEEDKTAEVTYYSRYIDNYSSLSGRLDIPGVVEYNREVYTVTSIGSFAFDKCSKLTSVIIPNTVTQCYESSFGGCTGLVKSAYPNFFPWSPFYYGESIAYPAEGSLFEDGFIYGPDKSAIYFAPYDLEGQFTISNSVTKIGDSAFRACSGMTSVTIPNSVTEIGNYAFYGCNLLEITIPEAVSSLGRNAFFGNNNLQTVNYNAKDCVFNNLEGGSVYYTFPRSTPYLNIGDNVETLPNYFAYNMTNINSVIIPNSVTSIGGSAFSGCTGLTSVAIPNSVTSIGSYAFNNCTGLTTVTIGNSVTSIGSYAFYGCSGLTNVTIPNSVTSIGSSSFADCSGLTNVTIPNSVTSIGSYAFAGCTGLPSVAIPKSVTSIGNSAFYGCSGLTSVTIPNSVTSIGDGAFDGCDLSELLLEAITPPSFYSSFYNLYNTTVLIIPENTLLDYLSTGWSNFKNLKTKDGELLGSYNDNIFNYRYDSDTKEAILVDGNYRSLTNASIPERVPIEGSFYSVKAIGYEAFYNCSSLTNVTIPNSVTSIGREAFYGCSGLTNVTIPNSVTSIGSSAFYGCSGLTSATIPNSVTSIGSSAFRNCTGLTTVTIGNSVTEIGSSAFYGCSGLTNVTIPNSVTEIGDYAFNGCSGLTSVGIGNSVTSIGERAFYGCESLPSVTIPNCATSIGESAFQGCSMLESIILPGSLEEIGNSAFQGTALTDIVVPNASIGEMAFAGLNLDRIVLGANVETIGEKAFDGSNNISGVYVTAVEPPYANANTFSDYSSPLYVLEQSKDDYYNDVNCWYRFTDYLLIEPETVELSMGEMTTNEYGEKQLQLTATVSPANTTLQNILWYSSDPKMATVDNNGLVTFHIDDLNVEQNAKSMVSQKDCEITATTLYADSPIATLKVKGTEAGIDVIVIEGNEDGRYDGTRPNDVYNLQGVMLKRNASQEDIDALAPGLYIIGGRKVIVK